MIIPSSRQLLTIARLRQHRRPSAPTRAVTPRPAAPWRRHRPTSRARCTRSSSPRQRRRVVADADITAADTSQARTSTSFSSLGGFTTGSTILLSGSRGAASITGNCFADPGPRSECCSPSAATALRRRVRHQLRLAEDGNAVEVNFVLGHVGPATLTALNNLGTHDVDEPSIVTGNTAGGGNVRLQRHDHAGQRNDQLQQQQPTTGQGGGISQGSWHADGDNGNSTPSSACSCWRPAQPALIWCGVCRTGDTLTNCTISG